MTKALWSSADMVDQGRAVLFATKMSFAYNPRNIVYEVDKETDPVRHWLGFARQAAPKAQEETTRTRRQERPTWRRSDGGADAC